MILGRFRVERILGHGGMGEVLLAHDTLLNRRVALKHLPAEGSDSAERRSAILKEARRASQVSDPRIAAIYDVLDFDNDVLIVMEYVDGATLRERMSAPIPVSAFWDISTQCVEAVSAAHSRGVIHRDIKPENLMVTREGRIKVLDFGISRRAETPEGAYGANTTTTTTEMRPGAIAGTPQYMAPEAHYGGRIDRRTDIFSLGTVFYELLTARNPFAGPTYEAVLDRVMNATPAPLSETNPSVGPGLSATISKMIAKDPAQRYDSCEDLMRDLAAARLGESVTAPAAVPALRPAAPAGAALEQAATLALPAAAPRRAIRWPVVATAVVALAAAGTALGLWRGALGAALPADRNVAILAPRTPGASEDFAAFALGAVDLLAGRLQKHQARAGFQFAPFAETVDEKVTTAEDARKIQGVNLALLSTIEQRADVFRARLDLWDAARGRVIASRTRETQVSKPYEFLDHLHGDVARMLRLHESGADAASEWGVRGAGTLRFLLQGVGRARTATLEAQARRAAEDLELACRAEPGAAIPRAWLSFAQQRVVSLGGDRAWLDRAVASAREAISRDSTRAEPYRSLGSALWSKNDWQGALVAYERACGLSPTNDATVLRLARVHTRLLQPEKEKETYLAAIAGRPHCWQPWWWLATWEYHHGRIEESMHAYREMIRCSPDLYRGYASLGGLMVLKGDYAPAVDTLKRSIALRPNQYAFDNLGTAYFNSGRLDEAVDAYNQSFQFGFAGYLSWLNLGDSYYWLRGRQDQAAEAYREAVRMGREERAARAQQGRPPDVMIPAVLSSIFPKLGQPDSARIYLRAALRADSANSWVQQYAALTCWQLGERKQALAWLERAVQNGYPIPWLRDSPVYQEWREEEAFRALIASAGEAPSRSPGKGGRT
jgi:serine/threonine-protein kinase